MSRFIYESIPFSRSSEIADYLSLDARTVRYWLRGKEGDITKELNERVEIYKQSGEELKTLNSLTGRKFNSLSEVTVYLKSEYEINYRSLKKQVGSHRAHILLDIAFGNKHLFMVKAKEPFLRGGIHFKNLRIFCSYHSIDYISFKLKYIETNGDINRSIHLAKPKDYYAESVESYMMQIL